MPEGRRHTAGGPSSPGIDDEAPMKIPYKAAIVLNKLRDLGCGPIRQEGEQFRCRCPAHNDNNPSLYVGFGKGKILVKCNADCTHDEVCDRLDHPVADLFFDEDEPWIDADGDLGLATPGEALAAQTGAPASQPG